MVTNNSEWSLIAFVFLLDIIWYKFDLIDLYIDIGSNISSNESDVNGHIGWFDFIVFNGILSFVGYLIPKPSL